MLALAQAPPQTPTSPGVLSTPLKIKTSAVYAGLQGTPDGRTQIRHATRHATRVVWRPSHRTQEIDVVSLPSSVDGVVRAFFLSFVSLSRNKHNQVSPCQVLPINTASPPSQALYPIHPAVQNRLQVEALSPLKPNRKPFTPPVQLPLGLN